MNPAEDLLVVVAPTTEGVEAGDDPAPAAAVVDTLLEVSETAALVEEPCTGVVEDARIGVVAATEADVEVATTGVGLEGVACIVVEATALPGTPTLLVQKPCSGVTSGKYVG